MASAFCPTCGTEVDDDARFCPACGTTIRDEAEAELPEAPPWPEPPAQAASEQLTLPAGAEPDSGEPPPADREEPSAGEPQGGAAEEQPGGAEAAGTEPERPAPERVEPPPPPVPPRTAEPPPAPATKRDADLPLTWPTTLSGWLIGGGAVLGALALIASLSDAVSLLLMLALAGVAASVFLADRLPEIPRLRLVNLSITMVGLGVALERAGFGARGADSVLLVAMIAAAGGALLIELDRDRPVTPPS